MAATLNAASLPPPTIVAGSGQDTIELDVNEDAYMGDAQFIVAVDGMQIGDILTTTALNNLGQQQSFLIEGDFGRGPHAVSIDFLNDLYAGTPDTDRNLYVQNVRSGGVITPSGLRFYSAGTQTLSVQVPPQPVTIGAGPDDIVLKIAEDAYQGDAQFTISVDGTQIGGVQTAQALRSSGLDQTFNVLGTFGYGGHSLTIDFLNDLYAGTPETDRNSYVDTFTRETQGGSLDAVLHSSGPVTLNLSPIVAPDGPQTIGSGPDSIVITMSEDAYFAGNEVDARFKISVDGVQVGGVETTAALHASRQTQAFTAKGKFGAGPHLVSVDFLNDAYGGTPTTDRNLYVDTVRYGGLNTPVRLALYDQGTRSFTVLPAAAVLTGSNVTGPDSGDAVLNGTSGDDVIVAHGSGNTINGLGGNDAITGAEGGGDMITVGALGDQLFGLQDKITVAGAGNSVIAGDEAVTVSGAASDTFATFGNGANNVALDGVGNNVTVGYGANTITATGGTATVTISGFGPPSSQTYSDAVTIGGDGNKVTAYVSQGKYYANGNVSVSGGTGNGIFAFSGGTETLKTDGLNNQVTIAGGDFDITAGSGSDTVTASGYPQTPSGTVRLAGRSNTVQAVGTTLTVLGGEGHGEFDLTGNASFGGGSATIATGGAFNAFNLIGGTTTADAGSGNDTVTQSGGTSSLVFHGSGNMLFLHPGPANSSNGTPATSTVQDLSTDLQVFVDPGLGSLDITQLGPSTVFHLLDGAGGYTSGDQAFHALTQYGEGVQLDIGGGSMRFEAGAAPLSPANFVIG